MAGYLETVIDHLNIGVSDAERSRVFYEKILATLGLRLLLSIPPERAELGGEQERTGGPMHGFGRGEAALLDRRQRPSGPSHAHRLHRAQPRGG